LKDAMEGMHACSEMKEEILFRNAEIREIFKISKVGSIAGCMVMDGKKIARNSKIELFVRGVVVHTGES
jgi:translation initiation factor IF-2